MDDNDGPADPWPVLWTERLETIDVVVADAPPVLTLCSDLTPISGSTLHATMTLRGELCPSTTPIVADATERLLDIGVVDIAFDLRELEFCTSAAVDFWLELDGRLAADGGDVRLRNASGSVRRVLEVCGLDGIGIA